MKTFSRLFIVFGLFFLSACSMELKNEPSVELPPKPAPSGGNEVETKISVTIPGGFSVMDTRALSAEQEAAIEEAEVLIFDSAGKFVKKAQVASSEIESTGATASMTVKVPSGPHLVTVLVNAADIVSAAAPAKDEMYGDIVSRLTSTLDSRLFPSADDTIPMWGEKEVDFKQNTTVKVDLCRSVARIDIGVGAWNKDTGRWNGLGSDGSLINFRITEIYVISPSREWALVPETTVSTDKLSVAESKTGFRYSGADITTEGSVTSTSRSIYIPEVTIVGTNYDERTALVIGGQYGGSDQTTYYRVDFNNTQDGLLDIERNELYRFSIARVSGAGFPSVETAYAAQSGNIDASIIDWGEETVGDAHFIGDKSIVLSQNPAKLGYAAGEKTTVVINTDIEDGFTMTLDTDGSKTLSSAANTSVTTDNFTYTIKSDGAQRWTVEIAVRGANINSSSEKIDTWTVDAGELLTFGFSAVQASVLGDPTPREIRINNATPAAGDGRVVANFASAPEKTPVTLLASAAIGKKFVRWVVDDGGPLQNLVTTDNPSTFLMPAKPVALHAEFEVVEDFPKEHTITVTGGTGGRAVASHITADKNETVTLMAAPEADYVFSSWTITGATITTSTANPQNITVSGNVTATANFKAKKAINVTPNNASWGAGSANVAKEVEGNTVTVTAVPATGFIFTGWSGATFNNAQANPATFTMGTDAAAITATFARQDAPLNVAPNNPDWGTVTALPQIPIAGETVTLTVTPQTGYKFKNYSAAGATMTGNTFTMPAGGTKVSIVANFEPIDRTVTISTAEGGSASTPSTTMKPGSQVIVTATPSSGWVFSSWTVTGATPSSTMTNPSSFIMPESNVTVKPVFVRVFTPTVDATNGTFTMSASSAQAGGQIKLTAAPNAGYSFQNWTLTTANGATISPTSPATVPTITLTMGASQSANPSLKANFISNNTYVVNTPTAQHGEAVPDNKNPRAGEQVQIWAVAEPGYMFTGWNIGSSQITPAPDLTANPLVFSMPASAVTITPLFAVAEYYRVTVNNPAAAIGTGTANPSSNIVPGAEVKLNAVVADTGDYVFTSWRDVGNNIAVDPAATASSSFRMPRANATVEAVFTRLYHKVTWGDHTADDSPANFSDLPTATASSTAGRNPVTEGVYSGTSVTLTAVPPRGDTADYTFAGWTFTGATRPTATSTANPYSFSMLKGGFTAVAAYTRNKYKVTLGTTTGITVTNGTNAATATGTGVVSGTQVTFTASDSAGTHTFSGWVVTPGTVVTTDKNQKQITITMPKGSVTVTPSSGVWYYKMSWGTHTPSGTGATATSVSGRNPTTEGVTLGNQVTLTATPPNNATKDYTFNGWSFAGTWKPANSTANPYSFAMNGEGFTATAAYTRNNHKVTIAATMPTGITSVTNGNTDSGTARTGNGVYSGTSLSYTANVAANYHFTGWEVTGEAITDPATLNKTNTTIAFKMPMGGVTLKPTAAEDAKYTISATTSPSGLATIASKTGYVGAVVSFTAPTVTDYPFVNWTLPNGSTSTSNPINYTITAKNETLIANYDSTRYYSVLTSQVTGGTVSFSTAARLTGGETITATVTPQTDYIFAGWTTRTPSNLTVTAKTTTATNSTFSFTMPTSDVTLTPKFIYAPFSGTRSPAGQVAMATTDAANPAYLIWATTNLSANETFASTATTAGTLFMWSQNTAIGLDQNVSPWPAKTANTTWPASVDPCPAPWRVPTNAEWQRFLSQTTDPKTSGNRTFVLPNGVITLPGAGYRISDGTVYDRNTGAMYWSSTYSGTVFGGMISQSFLISWKGTDDLANNAVNVQNAVSVRCVRTP